MATQLDDRQMVNRAALSALGNTANLSLDVIMGDINTYFANATFLPTASVLMTRDANANTQANNFLAGFVSTATAATTTTLTVASKEFQQFTGTTTQTVVLPAANTLTLGQSFVIANRSTGNVTVQNGTPTTIQTMTANSQAVFTVSNIGSIAGTWDISYTVTGPQTFLQTQVITDATTTGSATTLQSADILVGNVRLTNGSLVSVSGIPAGAAGQQIIVENQTGNTITINNNDAGATAANRIFTGTGGAAQMAANASFEFVYDATTTRWMLVGGTGSGSGSGSKNYLTTYTASTSSGVPNVGNGNFELGSTTGWSLAHSALTSSVPSTLATATNAFSSAGGVHGGSAASANLTLATVTGGSQISGSYSGSLVSSSTSVAGDMMISSAFNIDASDQNQVLTIGFDYKVVSGTFNLSGTSSNSFALYIYDVTNAAWIQPAGVYGMVQSSGVGHVFATFQSTSNTTQYQVALVNINSIATSYSLTLDDLSVGPNPGNQGIIATPNTFTVLTTGSGTYTPPVGTYQIKVRAVGGGSGGAGTGSGNSGGNGNSGGATTFAGGSLSMVANPGSVGTSSTSTHAPGGTASGGSVNIVGGIGGPRWANSIAAPGGPGGASPLGAGGAAGEANQTQGNAAEGFGGGGGGGGCSTTSTPSGGGAGGSGYCEAVVNLSTVGANSFSYAVGGAGGGGGAGTSGVVGGSGSPGVIIIEEFYYGQNVQISSQSAANGPVLFAVTNVSQNLTTTPTIIKYTTVNTDTYSGYNSGTGVYTIPVTGYYDIYAMASPQTPGSAYNGTTTFQINVNGSSFTNVNYALSTGIGTSNTMPNTIRANSVLLNAGTTVSVQISANNSYPSTALFASGEWFSITQVVNPQQILAAVASVGCSAQNASGQVLTTAVTATITGWTKIYDSHGAFNASTGIYTVPISGKYSVSTQITTDTGTTDGLTVDIVQTGSASTDAQSKVGYNSGNTVVNTSVPVTFDFACLAGDTIKVQASQSSGSNKTLQSSVRNIFSIRRVGN